MCIGLWSGVSKLQEKCAITVGANLGTVSMTTGSLSSGRYALKVYPAIGGLYGVGLVAVTIEVTDGLGHPLAGQRIHFEIISGPHIGQLVTATQRLLLDSA